MIEFVDLDKLTLEQVYTQLGMVDYAYVQTHKYIEHLEAYRSLIVNKIGQLHGNSKSVDNSEELFTDYSREVSG